MASTVLLQPAPARAALLRLLAATVRWEPGVQLPAASGREDDQVQGQSAAREPGIQVPAASGRDKREGQPSTLHGNASAPSAAEELQQLGSAAGAAEDEEEQRQRQRQEAGGYEAQLGQELHELQHGACWLVSQLLRNDCGLPELVSSRVPKLLLSLDFGCSLLQARVLQCLSRQLAAVSGALVGQLPEAAAAVPQPMRGQRQQQQQCHGYQDQKGMAGVSSPQHGPQSAAQVGAPGRVAAASREGVKGPVRDAEHVVSTASTLVPSLHSLMLLAADAYCSAGSSSSGLGPSHGSQPPDAAGVKQLRQLSRRFLLLLAGGLRDSHYLDHWARALLLSALCRGTGEQGGEEDGGAGEERTGRERPTHGAGEAGRDRGDRSERGVSGAAGQAAAVLAAAAAGGIQQHQQARSSALDVNLYWHNVYTTGSILLSLREAAKPGSNNLRYGLPPSLDAALQQALSGPCTKHLTLALGALMLHQADGGSLYGMPPPYRTGGLVEALAAATQDLASGGSGAPPLQLLDMPMYCSLQHLLTNFGNCAPQSLPGVPPEGHLDLLLRLGRLAVRSAQAYRGQEGSMGPRVAVIGRRDVSAVALMCLQTARGLLSSSAGTIVGAGGGVETGPGRGPGATGGEGGMGGAAAAATGADTAQAAAGQSGCRAAAARRAARAVVAAETRWHRLLLDTGLWVEMEGDQLAVWAEAWNHFESLRRLGEGTGAWGNKSCGSYNMHVHLCIMCSVCDSQIASAKPAS